MSMGCRTVSRWSSAYLDGELDAERAQALRGHLQQCVTCRHAMSDLAAMVDAASQLPPVDSPPAHLWSAIERELAADDVRRGSGSGRGQHVAGRVARLFGGRVARLFGRLFGSSGGRPYVLPGLAIAAVVLIAVVWGARLFETARDNPEARTPTSTRSMTASTGDSNNNGDSNDNTGDNNNDNNAGSAVTGALDASFLGRRAAQVRAEDRAYRDTIEELRSMVDAERATWPDAVNTAFDERIGQLEAAARRHEYALTTIAAHAVEPRDALYAVYRAEIAFLQGAAIDGPPELPAAPRSSPPGAQP